MTNTPNTLPAWEMMVAILVGLDQAIAQASAEYEAAVTRAQGNPFGSGVSTAVQIRNSLMDARRILAPDVHQIARANGYALPEGV